MHDQQIFMYKKETEVFFLEIENEVNTMKENLTGWQRTRKDLLGGAGVDDSAASIAWDDAEDVGGDERLLEGEVEWDRIGFRPGPCIQEVV